MSDLSIEATEQALRQHDAFLKSIAVSLLGDRHLADDVVQATWLAAIEKQPAVRNWRAWAGTVVGRIARNERRSRKRRAAHEAAFEAEAARVTPDAAAELSRRQTLSAVTTAVLALPEPYQATVLMRYFEGLLPNEIAARTGQPIATIKSRLQHALQALRADLSAKNSEAPGGGWQAGLVLLLGNQAVANASGKVVVGAATWNTAGVIVMSTKIKLLFVIVAAVLLLCIFWAATKDPALPAETKLVRAQSASSPNQQSATGIATAVVGDVATPVARIAADEATIGSIDLQVVYGEDGSPAAGVGVSAYAWGDPHARLHKRRLQVDDSGHVALRQLHRGRVAIYGDRGGYVSVDLEGEHASATLTIPAGVNIEGTIVDSAGFPVSEAEVWLSDHGNFANGGVATVADMGGNFRLRAVGTQHAVMARKQGFGASDGVWVQGSIGATRAIQLVLPTPGAAVRVCVEDMHGVPIAGARVRVGAVGQRHTDRNDGMFNVQSVDYVLASSRDGSCLADSVTPGTQRILVNAIGYAPWQIENFTAKPGLQTVRARLQRGTTVIGKVQMPSGEPVAGVTIRFGGYGDDDARDFETPVDGRFHIEGLPAAQFDLVAYSKTGGKATVSLAGGDGQILEWNPIVDPGRILRGRVVDEAGNGLPGCMVNVHQMDPSASYWGQAVCDDAGGFVVLNCPAGALQARVIVDRSNSVFADAEFPRLHADGSEHELRVLDEQRCTAYVSGRVVGVDSHLAALPVMLLRVMPRERLIDGPRAHAQSRHRVWSDVATGRFRVGPVAPGTYEISVASGAGSVYSGEFALVARELRDLGDLKLGGKGKLSIKLALPPDLRADEVSVDVVSRYAQPNEASLSVRGDQLQEAYELPSGPWLLSVHGEVLRCEQEVRVTSGEIAHAVLEPLRGATVNLRVEVDASASRKVPASVAVRVFSMDGTEVVAFHGQLNPQGRTRMVVPLGDAYRVVVETVDGLVGEATFGREALVMDHNSPAPEPVSVLLRRAKD